MTFAATVLLLPGDPLPRPVIVDRDHRLYVGFITENNNAELAESFSRTPGLCNLFTWRPIPEGAVEQ